MAKNDKAKKKPVATKTRLVTAKDDPAEKPAKKPANKKTTNKASSSKKNLSPKSKTTTTTTADKTSPAKSRKKYNIFAAFWGYLKGAWYELTQVRWPNRRETWGMTIAVLLFSAFFVVLILGLDAIYKYLFDFILEG